MKQLLAILFVAMFASISCAQEAATMEAKAPPAQVEKTKKMLKSVTLTAEQEAGFEAAAATLATKIAELEERGMTEEKVKEIDAKRAEGRESGLKGKALQAHLVADLPEDEKTAFMDYRKSVTAFDSAVAKMLTEEQIETLPGKVKKRMTAMRKPKKRKGGKGGKGKKKKDAAMENDAAADAAE